jgi:hypothetical protein
VPRLAAADVSLGTRRSRPAGSSAQPSATPRAQADATATAGTSPGADAEATASLSRLRDGRLLDLDGELSLAGVGLRGSSPFTLACDPGADSLLPTGELTLGDLTGEAPAGIGVLETGPIASGNRVGVDVGDVSRRSRDRLRQLGRRPRRRLASCAAGTGAGAASDLLALVAAGLLTAGALVVRATRPAAATEGGEDR